MLHQANAGSAWQRKLRCRCSVAQKLHSPLPGQAASTASPRGRETHHGLQRGRHRVPGPLRAHGAGCGITASPCSCPRAPAAHDTLSPDGPGPAPGGSEPAAC